MSALDGESPPLRRSRRHQKKRGDDIDSDDTKATAHANQEPSAAETNAQADSQVKSSVNCLPF